MGLSLRVAQRNNRGVVGLRPFGMISGVGRPQCRGSRDRHHSADLGVRLLLPTGVGGDRIALKNG